MRSKRLVFITALSAVLVMATSIFFFRVNEQRTVDYIRTVRPVRQIANVNLSVNSYYFAGKTSERFFLANTTQPFTIRNFDRQLNEQSPIQISSYFEKPVAWRAALVWVDSPNVFYAEVITPNYLIANAGKPKVRSYFDIPYKIEIGLPLDSSNFLVRIFDTAVVRTKLTRLTCCPERQVDFANIFELEAKLPSSKEGIINYDRSTRLVCYTFYYDNRFVVFDTSGRIKVKGETIDTCCNLENDAFNRETFQKGLRVMVNRKATVDRGKLFIVSTVRTKDSKGDDIPIDAYSLESGDYLFSLYLEKIGGSRISSLEVIGSRIFGIFNDRLVAFDW